MTKKKVRKLKTSQQGPAKFSQAKAAVASDARAKPVASKQEHKAAPVSRLQAFKQYLIEVRAEFDKITWPNRKETISMTIAVMAISVFFSVYLGLVDMSLSKLVGTIIK